MSEAPYITIPQLIALIEDRDVFPSGIATQDIVALVDAARRMIERAHLELEVRGHAG